jgi:hypothetical protein
MLFGHRLSIVLALVLCAACHHHPPLQDGVPLVPGTMLLLPPRNVIQDGVPHRVGVDSGAYFARSLEREFTKHGWRVVTPTDSRFSNTDIAPADEAIAEARKVNAEYVFRTVLGEFRDAAPMTFRADFVTLDTAHLWHAENGALVWSLPKPMVSDVEVERALLTGPPRTIVDPLGSVAHRGAQCSTEQILSMKKSGLTDDQVRRACGQ